VGLVTWWWVAASAAVEGLVCKGLQNFSILQNKLRVVCGTAACRAAATAMIKISILCIVVFMVHYRILKIKNFMS
jgi:hypothetical protein